MAFEKSVVYGLIYTIIGTGYLFLFMITFSPRVWGYQDYPERVKKKVPSQTRREKIIAGVVGFPWLSFILFYPIFTTSSLKAALGGEISFGAAFFNLFFMVFLFFLVDLVILDWLIISIITPKFVIIDGTTSEDYKDFSHHYKGHLVASIPITLICIILSAIFVWI